MLDLAVLRRKLDEAGDGVVWVTPSAMRQIIAELEAGREASARTGRMFGLGKGKTI